MEKIKALKFKYLNTSALFFIILFGICKLFVYLSSIDIIYLPLEIIGKLNAVSLALITFFIINIILRLSLKKVTNFFEEREEKIFYSKLYIWGLYITASVFLLYNFGVSLSNITLFVGLLATGFGFAVRDVLLSFFSWMILLRKKPFKIGDYIKIGEDEGQVQHIGTFYVLLDKTPDIPEDYVRVPNKIFLEKSISNFGKNSIHDTISFQLKEIPSDIKKLIKELEENIKNLAQKKDFVSVIINLKEEKIYLLIEYLVSFKEKRSLRTKVIEIAYNKFKKYIQIKS